MQIGSRVVHTETERTGVVSWSGHMGDNPAMPRVVEVRWDAGGESTTEFVSKVIEIEKVVVRKLSQ